MNRHSLLILILICVCAAAAGAVETVDNGPASSVKMEEVRLVDSFHAGGEDDEVFFGVVTSVLTDPDGNLYVLDSQQKEVQVYARGGEWLRTISREGEGPGEIASPNGFYLDNDGNVCILDGMMGKVVRVTPDGLPLDNLAFDPATGGAPGMRFLFAGCAAPDGMVFLGMRLIFGQTAVTNNHYFLVRTDPAGRQTASIHEKDHLIDYSDFRMDEVEMDFVHTRWTCDDAGRVYVARDRNDYRIEVIGADGELERVITREYESLTRNARQRRVAEQIIEGVAGYHGRPLLGLTISDVEPDIVGMQIMPDGNLWVRTSRGEAEQPEGVFSIIDVFSPEGTFLKQVAVKCDADPNRDQLVFLDDGRAAVVVSSLNAWLTQQRVAQEAGEEVEEAPPLEVIVYDVK